MRIVRFGFTSSAFRIRTASMPTATPAALSVPERGQVLFAREEARGGFLEADPLASGLVVEGLSRHGGVGPGQRAPPLAQLELGEIVQLLLVVPPEERLVGTAQLAAVRD